MPKYRMQDADVEAVCVKDILDAIQRSDFAKLPTWLITLHEFRRIAPTFGGGAHFEFDGTWHTAKRTDWIVRESDGYLRLCSDHVFVVKYRALGESKPVVL